MSVFQPKPGDSGRKPAAGEPLLTLAAFGKHPGWDDHMPGIGIDTEMLAWVKGVLYVKGIGAQIDSGAWEKLDSDKRQEGFAHTFLWLAPNRALLGEVWSSVDGKGRAKYPMALCVESAGIPPNFLLARVKPELERLKAACKAAPSGDQVAAECSAAQERLRAIAGAASPPELVPSLEARRRFLESPELGPGRIGLLRVMHELEPAIRRSGGAAASRSVHLRVPSGSRSPEESIPAWGAFLECALPDFKSLLLLAREGADWLDVIIGEPASEDFFCLQAAPKALPPATAIPYELPAELRPLLQEIEAKFLLEKAPAASPEKAPARPPPGPSRPVDAVTASPASPAGNGKLALWLVGIAIIAGLSAAAWFLSQGRSSKSQLAAASRSPSVAKISNAVAAQPTSPAAPATSNPNSAPDKRFDELVASGKKAMADQKYSAAAQSFEAALGLRPNDSAARQLLNEANTQAAAAAAQAQARAAAQVAESNYLQAVNAGKDALAVSKFDEAQSQLRRALAIKPNDPQAMELSNRVAQQQQSARLEAASRAVQIATQAMQQGNYEGAIQAAGRALDLNPGDAAAQQVFAQAKQQKDAEAGFASALAAAQTAYQKQDYDHTIARARAALGLKPGNPEASNLLARAERDQNYIQAMAAASNLLAKQDFAGAQTNASRALALKGDDAAATALLAQIQQGQKNLEVATLAAKEATNGLAVLQKKSEPKTNPTVAVAVKAAAPGADLAAYDMELRNLMIELQVKPRGGNILTNGGTSKPVPNLTPDLGEFFLKRIDKLRAEYKAHAGWLDSEREKDLKALDQAVPYY